jgi:muramoyltetrapeptide carboxypeptidase
MKDFVFIQPSSGLTEDEFKIIQGIFPQAVEKSFVKSTEPYLANDDTTRFKELKEALYHKDKKIIWATLGGYGSTRLLEQLQTLEPPKNPKIFIGYSDATFLHLLLHKWGWKTIHGAMPYDLTNNNIDRKNFILIAQILKNLKGTLRYTGLTALNQLASGTKKVEGEILGGNLTLLANSLGTDWQLEGNHKIIFIEDIGSNGYVVDRDLTHLKQVGIFKNAKAILFGKFCGGDQNVEYAIKHFAESIPVPVFYADFFGHGDSNYPLPFGFPTSIVQQKNGTFNLTIGYNFSNR